MGSELCLNGADGDSALESEALSKRQNLIRDFSSMATKCLEGQRDDLGAGCEGVVLGELLVKEGIGGEEGLAGGSLVDSRPLKGVGDGYIKGDVSELVIFVAGVADDKEVSRPLFRVGTEGEVGDIVVSAITDLAKLGGEKIADEVVLADHVVRAHAGHGVDTIFVADLVAFGNGTRARGGSNGKSKAESQEGDHELIRHLPLRAGRKLAKERTCVRSSEGEESGFFAGVEGGHQSNFELRVDQR